MEERFGKALKELTGSVDQPLVAAVSGGLDSMVMVHMCYKLDLPVQVAHVNFALRGEESDGDAAFVRQACNTMNIQCRVRKLDTRRFMEEEGLAVQEAARELRYRWFTELLHSGEVFWVATAHHRDDNIETFLINGLRGCGSRGLRGIPARQDRFVRPLLQFSRTELQQYAKSNEIEYREDSSNQSDDYLRNRIRHHVIPALARVRDDFPAGLMQTIAHMGATADFLHARAEAWWQENTRRDGERIMIRKTAFGEAHAAVLAQEKLSEYGFNSDQVSRICQDLPSSLSGKRVVGKGYAVVSDREELVLAAEEQLQHSPVSKILEHPVGNIENGWKLEWKSLEAEQTELSFSNTVAMLDLDKLDFPLELRTWQKGDTLRPLGMDGTKKVSDLLTDLKVNPADKPGVLVLCSQGEVAWVLGYRISDHFKVTPGTRRVIHFRFSK